MNGYLLHQLKIATDPLKNIRDINEDDMEPVTKANIIINKALADIEGEKEISRIHRRSQGEEMTHYPIVDFIIAMRQLKRAILREVKPFIEPILKRLCKILEEKK